MSLSRMFILDYGHFQPFLQIGIISPLPCVSKPSERGDEKPTVAWEFRIVRTSSGKEVNSH